MDPIFEAFSRELEKRAVSAATTLKLLQGRAAQGARVAPGLMAKAQHAAASGAATTAPGMRRVALEAGDAARLQQRTQALAPVKSGLQGRIQSADAMGAKAFDQSRPLQMHDALGNTHNYSQAHIDTIAGSASRVSDPKGLIPAQSAGVGPTGTAPAAKPAAGGTAVARPSRKLAPVQGTQATAVNPLAKTMVSGPPQMTAVTGTA